MKKINISDSDSDSDNIDSSINNKSEVSLSNTDNLNDLKESSSSISESFTQNAKPKSKHKPPLPKSSLKEQLDLKNELSSNKQLKNLISNDSKSLLCQKQKKEIDSLKVMNLMLSKDKSSLENENKILKLQIEKMDKLKETEVNIINEKLESAENFLKIKNEENSELQNKIDNTKKELWNYESLRADLDSKKDEIKKLKENIDEINRLNIQLNKEIGDNKNKINQLSLYNDNFKKERSYLVNEHFVLTNKNKELTSKVDDLDKEIKLLKEEKKSVVKKLGEVNELKEGEIKERVRSAMSAREEKYKADLEGAKKNLEIMNEAKIKFLMEQNDDLNNKLNKQKNSVDNKNNENLLISEESKNQINLLKDEISYLNIKLKIKTEDYTRLKNLNDENVNIINQIKTENDTLKEQLKLINDSLYDIKSNYSTQINNLTEELTILKQQAKSYEQSESELDKILCDSSLLSTNDKDSLEFINALNNIPINSKRRTNQCLILAHRLKQLCAEVTNCKKENLVITNELNNVKNEKNIMEGVADKLKQPYETLLCKMNEIENENRMLKEMNCDKDEKIKVMLQEYDNVVRQKNEVEGDLKTVLGGRKKIDEIEFVIKNYIQNKERFKKNENDGYRGDAVNNNANQIINMLNSGNTNKSIKKNTNVKSKKMKK